MTKHELVDQVEYVIRTEHPQLFADGYYRHDLDAVVDATVRILADVSTSEILVMMLSMTYGKHGDAAFRVPFSDNDFPYDLYDRDTTTIRDLLVWSMSDLISGEVYNRCDRPAK